MHFASDNWAGASAPVAAALADANHGLVPSYGADDATRTATEWFAEIFEKEVAVFFVGTGTAANALALASFMKPGGFVFCHENAHVAADEAGAPEFYSGGKLMPLPGPRGKIQPATLDAAIRRYHPPVVMHGRPVGVTLSNLSEWGTAYTPDELRELSSIAHRGGLKVHMDGARFANALVSLTNVSAADLTWRAGVDALSFGGTKNGCWCAEAVVLFDPRQAEDLAYARKRAGHLFSKSRFVAAQFQGYFDHGHWLDNAVHANAMAKRLAAGITQSKDGRLLYEPEANEIFAIWSKATTKRLRAAGATFGEWPTDALPADERPAADEDLVRLVTSFATSKHDVAAFVRLLGGENVNAA